MLIDSYLPQFQFRERHRIAIAAPPERILRAALDHDPLSDRIVRAMIALREVPMRLIAVVGGGGAEAVRPPFGMANFTRLAVDEGREAVLGLAGRFWQAGYGQAPLRDGRDFEAFAAPGSAKLALNFAVTPRPDGRWELSTETRVFCLDAAARRRFTPYWYLIRPVSGLIRRRMLAAVRRELARG